MAFENKVNKPKKPSKTIKQVMEDKEKQAEASKERVREKIKQAQKEEQKEAKKLENKAQELLKKAREAGLDDDLLKKYSQLLSEEISTERLIELEAEINRQKAEQTIVEIEFDLDDLIIEDEEQVVEVSAEEFEKMLISETESQNESFGDYKIEVGSAIATTKPGRELKNSEDSYGIDVANGVFGVYDGVSTSKGSILGSKFVADKMTAGLADPNLKTVEQVSAKMRELAQNINQEMLDNDEISDTTGTVAKLVETDQGLSLVAVGAGDSPMYISRADGSLERVVEDDNVLNRMLLKNINNKPIIKKYLEYIDRKKEHQGYSDADFDKYYEFLKEVAAGRSNIDYKDAGLQDDLLSLHSLASNGIVEGFGGRVTAEPIVKQLNEGDKVFIFSDGVADNISEGEIKKLAVDKNIKTAEQLSDALVKESAKAQNKADDISAVVFEAKAKKRKVKAPPIPQEPEMSTEIDQKSAEPQKKGFWGRLFGG